MGLDISAYSNIKLIKKMVLDKNGYKIEPKRVNRFVCLDVLDDFKERADGIASGFYTYTNRYSYRFGSYSLYNVWREELAKLFGYGDSGGSISDFFIEKELFATGDAVENHTEGPFWELINFSDCDGFFGYKCCAKIWSDFWSNHCKFKEKFRDDMDDLFYARAMKLEKIFSIGMKNGCVVFE